MAGNLTRVLTDMQVPVIPAVGRDECRHVEAAASEIRDEHAAAGQACKRGRDAARDDVLLMAMNDRRPAQCAKHRRCDRVGSLAAHIPRIVQHHHLELSNAFVPWSSAECDQPGHHSLGHVSRQLERIPLRSANDPVTGIERRRNEVHDRQLSHLGLRRAGVNLRPAFARRGCR